MIQSGVAGLVAGGAYAMLAVVVVLMFRMVRVLNFSLAAIGAFGTFTMSAVYAHDQSYLLATLAGVGAAAGVAALLGAVMALWFADARIETRSTVAIAMLIGLLMVGYRVFGDQPRNVPSLFGSHGIKISGVVVTHDAIAIVVATILVAVGLSVFLGRTRVGLRLRALSERPQTAELLGVPARWLAIAVWAVAGAITALGTQMVAPTRANAFADLSLLIIPAFAAAAIGLFRSFYLALAGGIGIGILEGITTNYSSVAPYQSVVPLVVVVLMLMWSQRQEVWDVAR
ncbi:MAG: inner-rane translocator [Conexibacter sp.]|nr:inner-rane translocator [Conexibacter sp.]